MADPDDRTAPGPRSTSVYSTTQKIGGHNYGEVVVPGDDTLAKGSSNEEALRDAFPGSPVFAGTVPGYDEYYNNVLRGRSDINSSGIDFDFQVTDASGETSYVPSRTFAENGPPAFADVETGGSGLPSSAWTPNTNSPVSAGEPSTNYSDVPAMTAENAPTLADANDNPGVGEGGTLSPDTSSTSIQDL